MLAPSSASVRARGLSRSIALPPGHGKTGLILIVRECTVWEPNGALCVRPEIGAAWEVQSRSEFTAEEHRERARQCLCLARQMTDSSSKAALLHMAQVWVKLADALERSDAKSDTVLQTLDLFENT